MKSSKTTGRVPAAIVPVKKRRSATVSSSANSGLVITNSRNAKTDSTKKASSTKRIVSEQPPSSSPTPTISNAFRSLLDKNAAIIQRWFRNAIKENNLKREQVSLILQSHKNARVRPASPKKMSVMQKKREQPVIDQESTADESVRKRREKKAKAARDVF
jgi:hypothetical protein